MDENGTKKPSDTQPATAPAFPATPTTAEVLAKSSALAPITRFWHLLRHAKILIRLHGPHTTYPDTTVFTRTPTPRPTKIAKPPSAQLLATSLAAAQDAYGSAQPDGPAKEDLDLFTALWKTTVQVVEQILEEGIPDGEAFGWGVYGLSFGYIRSFPTSSPSSSSSQDSDSADFDDEFFPRNENKPFAIPTPTISSNPETAFEALRQRLHTALSSLPGVSTVQRERGEKHRLPVSPAERVGRLVRTRNEVHLCGTLLVQVLREGEWRSVRWGHLVLVVERWLGNLELTRGGG